MNAIFLPEEGARGAMSEFFQANAEVLQRRWPALFARLVAEDSSAVQARTGAGAGLDAERQRHSTHQSPRPHSMKPGFRRPACRTKRSCTSMAPASAICPRCCWSEPDLQRLYVHILNGALFALVVQLLDQRQWLDDPRVELLYAGDHADFLHAVFCPACRDAAGR